jgi:hypothetical protein
MSNDQKMAALEAELKAVRRRLDEMECEMADMSWALKLANASITKHYSTAYLGKDSWNQMDQQAWEIVRTVLEGFKFKQIPCDIQKLGHLGSPCLLCGNNNEENEEEVQRS